MVVWAVPVGTRIEVGKYLIHPTLSSALPKRRCLQTV